MNIKDFKYAWRYTDQSYALFSENELSEMKVISGNYASQLWDKICDSKFLEESSYIKDLLNKTPTVYISDCGWGESLEETTKYKLMDFFRKQEIHRINILYDRFSALNVLVELFCDKWSDFCYPSDTLLITFNSKLFLYYEDVLYGPFEQDFNK